MTVKSDSLMIGSVDFEQKFKNDCRLDRVKLSEMLEQLGAVIDEFGMLQLRGPSYLNPQLTPHSSFYAEIRSSVQRAFNGPEGLKQDKLGLKIHLFRSYIDQQNLLFIRNEFCGETDMEKLENYRKKYQLEFDYSTGANYHNRTMGEFTYPQTMKVLVPKQNTLSGKVTNARMSEFIVNLISGQFVSQWNVYHRLPDGTYDTNPQHYLIEECGDIANTESYNYGLSHGQNKDISSDDQTHERLDVDHPLDLVLRRTATKIWSCEVSFSSGGRYADIVKSGLEDVKAWQLIQEDQRLVEYEAFLKHCKRWKRNRGFAYFKRVKKIQAWLVSGSLFFLIFLYLIN